MSVRILQGDCRDILPTLPSESVDCIVTSPPYWGLRSYLPAGHPDKARELGLEPTLGEHIATLIGVFRELRRVLKKTGVVWVNYGDCYATAPNGRSAADTKAADNDDRTFRDKPFSTVGPIFDPNKEAGDRCGGPCKQRTHDGQAAHTGRILAGGILKAKDLCMVPERLFIALQDDGWWVRSKLPWIKRNGMPESINDRPANSLEQIGLLTRSERYWYDADAVRKAASPSTNARVSQDVANQAGSLRANGGTKTNGPMKAVVRKPGVTPKSAPEGTNIKAKGSFHESTSEVLADRNFRNTDLFFSSLQEPWGLISDADGNALAIDATPQGFREAHYATFPPALIEPLILAGCPEKVCAECGNPWVRVVEKGEPLIEWQRACGGDAEGQYDGEATKDFASAKAQNASDVKRRILAGMVERKTAGFAPTCKCDAPTVPGTILDPFGGAGTVGLVADRFGRNAILIDLDRSSIDIAERRIRNDGPMFAEVAVA